MPPRKPVRTPQPQEQPKRQSQRLPLASPVQELVGVEDVVEVYVEDLPFPLERTHDLTVNELVRVVDFPSSEPQQQAAPQPGAQSEERIFHVQVIAEQLLARNADMSHVRLIGEDGKIIYEYHLSETEPSVDLPLEWLRTLTQRDFEGVLVQVFNDCLALTLDAWKDHRDGVPLFALRDSGGEIGERASQDDGRPN